MFSESGGIARWQGNGDVGSARLIQQVYRSCGVIGNRQRRLVGGQYGVDYVTQGTRGTSRASRASRAGDDAVRASRASGAGRTHGGGACRTSGSSGAGGADAGGASGT